MYSILVSIFQNSFYQVLTADRLPPVSITCCCYSAYTYCCVVPFHLLLCISLSRHKILLSCESASHTHTQKRVLCSIKRFSIRFVYRHFLFTPKRGGGFGGGEKGARFDRIHRLTTSLNTNWDSLCLAPHQIGNTQTFFLSTNKNMEERQGGISNASSLRFPK